MSQYDLKFTGIPLCGEIHDARIACAIEALHAEPRLNAKELASMLHLSTSRLQHLFKDDMGMTVSAYARNVRLLRASQLLERTLLPIKQIRLNVGMPDPSHFSRDFRKLTGMSPSHYRKQYCSSFGQQLAE